MDTTVLDITAEQLTNALRPLLHQARSVTGAEVAALALRHRDQLIVVHVDGDGTGPGLVGGAELLLPASRREPWIRVPLRERRELVGAMLLMATDFPRDLAEHVAVEALAREAGALIGPVLGSMVEPMTNIADRTSRVQRVLDDELFLMVFQPIVDVHLGETAALEALARFPAEPVRSPDAWFAEAADLGLGVALETAAARSALTRIDDLPADTLLAVNVSPETLASRAFRSALEGQPLDRIVIELTDSNDDDDALARSLRPLRDDGVRIAVNELGDGTLHLSRLVTLEPDVVKLDAAATHHVEHEATARALTAAVVNLTRGSPTRVAAQGVESPGQLDALTLLGVDWCQGFQLGRPRHLRT